MGTSRSSDVEWRASALLYSGRPNPEWPVTDADAERLVALWSALQTMRAQTSGAGLGYRGCTISRGSRRWHAFEGIAIMTSGTATEIRADTSRAFERAILATAPAGTIPETVRF
jgi:hypothetical protein